MKKTIAVLTAAVVLFVGTSVAMAGTITVDTSFGTGAPGATLGPYTMTPFGDDARPVFNDVTSVPSPLSGDLSFSIAMNHREIGNGWATWSHGYTGDVYYTNGASSVVMTMPSGTGAFYFYAEPNAFSVFDMTATANDGTTTTIAVNGSSGAQYFGFWASTGSSIASITISTANADFAVGEFGIASASVPLPSAALIGFGLLGGLGLVHRVRRRTGKA